MSSASLSVKLNCRSWQQLAAIYARDLSRSAFFLKTSKPPPLGTQVHISLTLPSDTSVELVGTIHASYEAGEFGGRGPGIDIHLLQVPHSVMWLIESALTSAGLKPALDSTDKSESSPSKPAVSEDGLDDGNDWIQAEAKLVQSLWEELNTMSKLNAFQRLNLDYRTTDEEVRTAFGQLSKQYHPDRFAQYQSVEIKELANEVFILIRDAYREISNETDRQKKREKLASGAISTIQPLPQAPSTQQAPPAFKQPPPVPRQANPTSHTKPSSKFVGKAPDALGMTDSPSDESTSGNPKIALGLRILDSGQYEEALRMLRIELKRNPSCIDAQVGTEIAAGRLALASGDRMEAAERFESALDIDPSNGRAAREIAEMRRYVTSQRRGLLSKLMNKV